MMKAIIAIVAVLVVVAGIIVVQGKGEVTPSSVNLPPGKILRAEKHVISCGEPDYFEGTYSKDGVTTTVLKIGKSTEGGDISYLVSPDGWIDHCNLNEAKKDDNTDDSSQAGKLPGLAVYNFEVQRDDDFYVFLSAKWTDTCGNSVWVALNGPEKGGHGPADAKYYKIKDQNGFQSEKDYKLAWHPLIKEGKPLAFSLKKGPNRIELHTRQDGPRFEQLVITTDANPPATERVKGSR